MVEYDIGQALSAAPKQIIEAIVEDEATEGLEDAAAHIQAAFRGVKVRESRQIVRSAMVQIS